jgi:acetyl esterase/lipase
MSLYQGLLGAQVELAALPPTARLQRAAGIARLFVSELAGTVALAPYALRAATLHRSLPAANPAADGAGDARGVTLARGVRYGTAPRAVADVYVPPAAVRRDAAKQASSRQPCVVFVHGGVWAAGEAFHYAPMAASLARVGVLTYVVTYSLYPDALVPALVGETAAALAFAMDDAPRWGGDPARVALVGHSAGAHLAAMALLYKAAAAAGVRAGAAAARAAARAEAAERQGGWATGQGAVVAAINPGEETEEDEDEDDALASTATTVDALLLHPAVCDPRMPALFVGAAGMYDAAKHYDFERRRGVHELSTLKRAMGGVERFAAMSPSAILGAATAAAAQAAGRPAGEAPSSARPPDALAATRFYEAAASPSSPGGAPQATTPWQLSGEAIAHRVGLDRESSGYAARDAQLAGQLALAGMRDVLPFPVAAAAAVAPAGPLLPPTVLMHAVGDATVPFDESTELHRRLLDAGAMSGSKVLLYRGKGVGHASFVLDWPAAAEGKRGGRWLVAEKAGRRTADGVVARGDDGEAWGGGAADGDEQEDEDDPDADFWDLVAELPPHCRDLALVVTGRAQIDFCKPAAEAVVVAAAKTAVAAA